MSGFLTYNPETHFLQPKLPGYRQLTPEQTALIAEGKELANQVGAYIEKLRAHPATNPGKAPFVAEGKTSLDQRFVSVGTTELQQGFMAVFRGIAQPTGF